MSESESYFTTGGLLPISSSWRQTHWDPRQIFYFQLNTCGYSPYVTSSLTRGWVCHLQLLLGLASTVIHGSKSRGTHDHILLSQILDSPNLEDQVPVLISPRNTVDQLVLPRTCLYIQRDIHAKPMCDPTSAFSCSRITPLTYIPKIIHKVYWDYEKIIK
jgi:hypothetical protein